MVGSYRVGNRWKNLCFSLAKLAISAGALTGLVAMQRSQLQQGAMFTFSPEQLNQQERWKLEVLQRSPTFGFDNLMADWVFLNFLQYDGDEEARTKLGYELAPQFFDLVTRWDPRFVESYLFLSGTLSYRLGKPELAVDYMTRGTDALQPDQHPQAFLPWRFKALDQLLLLGDVPGSIVSHDRAGDWALQSTDPEIRKVGPLMKQTAAFLQTDPDSRMVRLWGWSSVFEQAEATRDRSTQERARQDLLKIGAEERKDPEGRTYFVLPSANKPAATTQPETPASPDSPPPSEPDSSNPTESPTPDGAQPSPQPSPADSPATPSTP
ncbi:hypothetical protein [Alkalinema sp. FACHB-956]|uniref:hypothetical protein n=1 Tax=Alkalinema sp. FACHB-956 TaxID=2692768 RepID=UPI0016832DAC|nr:hypothetical protein [Alkalinema sp. FACHB-956]MBD2329454.1 hypothetical protein [Alkalinema sp. FACHB-956]